MIEQSSYDVNPQANISIQRIGVQQTPIIVVDDFLLKLDEFRSLACVQTFTDDAHSYYPGIRALLPKAYVITVLDALFQTIYDVYNIPTQLRLTPQDRYFSLITKQPEQLSLLQCMPHFDTPRPYYFAILHYLQTSEHGGTGFFRHRPTQLERIDEHNMSHYFSTAEQFINNHSKPEQGYCVASNDQFQCYDNISYQTNRLVVYPGNLLHSTLVNQASDISADPKQGRLTANLFIEFQ